MSRQNGATVEFRPSKQRFGEVFRAGLRPLFVVFGTVFVIVVVAFKGNVLLALGAFAPILILIAGVFGYFGLCATRPKVVIGPDAVLIRRLTRSHITPRRELGTVVTATIDSFGGGRPSNPRASGMRLYLLRKDGARLANLPEEFWGAVQFQALIEALGLPVDDVGDITLRKLRKRHKHAVRWAAAHQVTAVLLAFPAFFVLGAVVLVLVSLGTTIF